MVRAPTQGPQTDDHTDKLRNKPLNQLNVVSNFGENISISLLTAYWKWGVA